MQMSSGDTVPSTCGAGLWLFGLRLANFKMIEVPHAQKIQLATNVRIVAVINFQPGPALTLCEVSVKIDRPFRFLGRNECAARP